MINLAVNLSLLFTEVPFLERFQQAARAGFTRVETQFPYHWPIQAQAEQLKALGLTQVLINLPAGNWENGERGIACHPSRIDEFRNGVQSALEYARALSCSKVNCLAGIPEQGVSREDSEAVLVDNLRYAAETLATQGIELLLEPINTFDIPGFLVHDAEQAIALIKQAGSHNLALQYDVYHMDRMGRDVLADIATLTPLISHIQIADTPARHEPGSGNIPFPALFALLDNSGYQGVVSAEYNPATTTEAGLSWIKQLNLNL
ncbi:MAG: hydroxypyruvate isomerase [Oceanospirillaceae bacterium]|nr:hydroxypyruvate isomerase [Oceanospirillaceae bacterium]